MGVFKGGRPIEEIYVPFEQPKFVCAKTTYTICVEQHVDYDIDKLYASRISGQNVNSVCGLMDDKSLNVQIND